MKPCDKALKFLLDIERGDLAALLRFSNYKVVETRDWLDIADQSIEIASPRIYTEALSIISQYDKKKIFDSIRETDHEVRQLAIDPNTISFIERTDIEIRGQESIFAEIIIQKNIMVNVATGGSPINEVNDYYKARRKRISSHLQSIGLKDPNPYTDLWDWYHKWKSNFASYADRRKHVKEIYQELINKLSIVKEAPSPPREPTGWERVDRALEKSRDALTNTATYEEDFQAIGLLCREVIISLGQAVYNPEEYKLSDGTEPSKTDAYRMIELFIGKIISGKKNDNIRKYAKASLQLALELQHKRTANYRNAALCLEATSSIVNIIAILSGRRDPE